MQRLFFTFVFIFLVRGLLSAQGVLVTSPKSVHDFGVIQEKAGKVTHVFQIKNAGKVPEGRPGNFVKSVTVYCTGMKRGYQLRIRGTVEPEEKK